MQIKKILVISPFFFPEPISTGKFNTNLVNSLKDKGHKVTVLCFHPFYPEWKTKESNEDIDGVEIIRGGRKIYYPDKTILRRIILELSFLFFILIKIRKYQKDKDIVLPVFPPSFAFFGILFFLKNNIKKVGMVHDLQEVYSANKKGSINKCISFLINRIEKKCYSNCDKIIFLSQEMRDQAQKLYGLESKKLVVQYPFVTIKNHISNDLNEVIDTEKVNIVYSGALGEKQNPERLYNFFNYACDKIDNVVFHFFSQGTILEKLKEKNSNKNIRFHNLVRLENLEELYNKSDVQIIPQLPNTSKGSLPSKLPNLLVSGCKILLITDKNSEIENLFKANKIEKVVNSWEFDSILKALKELLIAKETKEVQKLVAEKYFTIDKMIKEIIDL